MPACKHNSINWETFVNDALWLVRKSEWPAVQLTKSEWAWDKHPRWSPDGAQIVLLSNRSGSQQLWLMNANGGNQRQLTTFAFDVWNPVWMKDTIPKRESSTNG